MNLQVCQKDCEPTVITINHREIIKEWAGALRLTEVHGWIGPLDVLGGVEAPLRNLHCVWFNLLVSDLNINCEMALLKQIKQQLLYNLYFSIPFFPFPDIPATPQVYNHFFGGRCAGRFVFFTIFCWHQITQAFPDFISFMSQYQHSLTTERFADFEGSHSKDLSQLKQ